MSWLLATAARRFYFRHPWQLMLAITGVGLGVAVYTGVDLANDSARRAFAQSAETVLGTTTHRLLPVGGELPEEAYRELVVERGVRFAAPVVETDLRLAEQPGRRHALLGVDPLQEIGFRGFSGWLPGTDSDFRRLIVEPRTVLVPEEVRLENASGRLDVLVAGRRQTLEVVGTVESAALGPEARAPFVADIATAQEILGRPGYLTRVDLVLTDAEAARLAADPPPGTTLVAAGAGDAAFNELTRAFHTNLMALGLLALFVGAFLIYATMSFAIVQRRETLGVLRAVGFDRRQLLTHVLLEAAILGVVATGLGLAMGYVLAQGLVELVLRTIADLYFTTAVAPAVPSPWIFVKGAVLGVGITLLAALAPAIDASRTPPEVAMRRAPLERSTRRRSRIAAWLAVPALIGAAVLLAIPSEGLFIAFTALALVLAAGALLTPLATTGLMWLMERPAERGFGLPGLLAVRGVTASLSRTGVATAALAVAVAAVIGVGVMITSFRASLIAWLDVTLTADLYLTTGGAADGEGFTPADVADLEALAEVAGLSLTRFSQVPSEHGELGLRAVQPGPRGWGLEVVTGSPQAAIASLEQGGVVVSEPLAYRAGLALGDALVLPTPAGDSAFPIVGIFRDYNIGTGSVVMALDTYRSGWDDPTLTGIGVDLRDGADETRLVRTVRSLLDVPVTVRSSTELRTISLQVFDRTFQITEVLRLLVGMVAFLGILSALLSIQLERARERAVLRCLGFAPRQLITLVGTQAGLLGLAAGILAMPLGTALAGLLVSVINRRSFGWSMEWVVTAPPLVGGVALAVAAALLAGAYPAWRAGRASAGDALNDE